MAIVQRGERKMMKEKVSDDSQMKAARHFIQSETIQF